MGKHKNNYKSKNGRYYVLKGSNAVMIAYNWDQANELPLGRIITVRSLMQQYLGNTEV